MSFTDAYSFLPSALALIGRAFEKSAGVYLIFLLLGGGYLLYRRKRFTWSYGILFLMICLLVSCGWRFLHFHFYQGAFRYYLLPLWLGSVLVPGGVLLLTQCYRRFLHRRGRWIVLLCIILLTCISIGKGFRGMRDRQYLFEISKTFIQNSSSNALLLDFTSEKSWLEQLFKGTRKIRTGTIFSKKNCDWEYSLYEMLQEEQFRQNEIWVLIDFPKNNDDFKKIFGAEWDFFPFDRHFSFISKNKRYDLFRFDFQVQDSYGLTITPTVKNPLRLPTDAALDQMGDGVGLDFSRFIDSAEFPNILIEPEIALGHTSSSAWFLENAKTLPEDFNLNFYNDFRWKVGTVRIHVDPGFKPKGNDKSVTSPESPENSQPLLRDRPISSWEGDIAVKGDDFFPERSATPPYSDYKITVMETPAGELSRSNSEFRLRQFQVHYLSRRTSVESIRKFRVWNAAQLSSVPRPLSLLWYGSRNFNSSTLISDIAEQSRAHGMKLEIHNPESNTLQNFDDIVENIDKNNNGIWDFKTYCTSRNISSVDYVVFALGSDEVFRSQKYGFFSEYGLRNKLRWLIQGIRHDSPDTQIIFILPELPNITQDARKEDLQQYFQNFWWRSFHAYHKLSEIIIEESKKYPDTAVLPLALCLPYDTVYKKRSGGSQRIPSPEWNRVVAENIAENIRLQYFLNSPDKGKDKHANDFRQDRR